MFGGKMSRKLMSYAAMAVVVAGAGASHAASFDVTSPIFVDGRQEDGYTTAQLGSGSGTDTISFKAYGAIPGASSSGTSGIQPLPTLDNGMFGTNAAGIVVVPDSNLGANGTVGSSYTDPAGNGLPAGSLIATLTYTVGGGMQITTGPVQIFASSSDNGLGKSSPPTSFTFKGSFGSLFNVTQFDSGMLNFRVNDIPGGYGDNAGGFTLNNAVPEMATWGMMILGFIGIGSQMRRRRSSTAAVA